MLLSKASFGYFKAHPFQTLAHILGVALGVALVISIDIANFSVEKSFQLSTESITGKTTHQIVGSYGAIDQSIYIQLRTELGFRDCAPVVTGHTNVSEFNDMKMQILGVDPFAETGFRGYTGNLMGNVSTNVLSSLLSIPGSVIIAKSLASKFGLKQGDTLTLKFGGRSVQVTIYGLTQNQDDGDEILSSLIYTDISTAQEILEMENRLSHIDLILKSSDLLTLENIRETLPASINIVPAASRSNAIRQMSKSFEFNLMAFSMLALLVGMFLIYNTVSFSVVQRRKLIGILRAVGVTRQEMFLLILKEAFLLAVIGTTLGILLGIFLGTLTVKMVGQTVSDFYFALTVTQFHVSSWGLLKGSSLGILASLAATILPALEANRIQPAEAMSRSYMEIKTHQWLPKVFALGILLFFIGLVALALPTKSINVGFAATALVVIGFSFCVPLLTVFFIRILLPLISRAFGITGKMAARNISRSISRTGVSIAALMVAVCVYIGVGFMIESFKQSLVQWIDEQIRGDIQIGSSDRPRGKLAPDMLESLRAQPGVNQVNGYYLNEITSGPYANTVLFVVDRPHNQYRWLWLDQSEDRLNETLDGNNVIVSETFAWRHNIKKGENTVISLDTPGGKVDLKIVGVFSDFFVKGGRIIIKKRLYQSIWSDYRISNIELFLNPAVDTEKLVSVLQKKYTDLPIEIVSRRLLKKKIMTLFDRTFAITMALQILSALVAFIGVLNTIMSLIRERQHEIGILRANGLTLKQLWKMILVESGIMGLLAGLFSIPLGSLLAWILVAVINKRSFGWTLEFHTNPWILLQAVLLAITAAVIAGIYPALKTGKMNLINAIRTE
ncbi:FtsX-like permease family protein [bacterium]|nr:FtsX-like permease family protein [bacterium]